MTGREFPGRAWGRLRRRAGRLRALLVGEGSRAGARTSVAGMLRGPPTELLGRPGDRTVVMLADADSPEGVQDWLQVFSSDHVSVFSVDAVSDLDDVVACLARLNAVDVIVVVLGSEGLASLAGDQGVLFEHLFLHLRADGVYVVDLAVDTVPAVDGRPGRADDYFHRILATTQGFEVEMAPRRRGVAIARFVKDISISEGCVVITKRRRHALMLREQRVGELLTAREPGIGVSVLEVRPPGRLDLQMAEESYGPSRAGPWPARLEYPEMTLRHYVGETVSAGGMRLYTGNTILPESFRWPNAEVPRNPRFESVTPLFARVGRRPQGRVLDGDFYFLDSLFSGHFGHLTTEVLCRLWGWDRAKREMPGLKVLFHTNPARGADGTLERRLFAAFGIPESDLVSAEGPVLLRSVVGASPMWHNKQPFYAHPDIKETWARLTSGLLAGADPGEKERIFVSRGHSLNHRRGCRNQQEVERFFADRGYHVCYPEELPLAEQARLFSGARVVAGFGGSAMFNLMHTQRLEAVVVISHNAYVARNEHLFTSVLGGQLHYFWQPSDVEPPKVGRSKASDRSSFAFDFATYGDDLVRVLAGL